MIRTRGALKKQLIRLSSDICHHQSRFDAMQRTLLGSSCPWVISLPASYMSWKLESVWVTGSSNAIAGTAPLVQAVSLPVGSCYNPTFKNVTSVDMRLCSKGWIHQQFVSGVSISVESRMTTASMFRHVRNFDRKKRFQSLNVGILPLPEHPSSVRVKFHNGRLSSITISNAIRPFLPRIRKLLRLSTILTNTKR